MNALDVKLLSFFNDSLSNPVFDLFFPFWTDVQQSYFFYGVMILIIGLIILKKNWKAFMVMGLCLLGMIAVGRLNSGVLKEFFNRSRPTETILRIAKPAGLSMPSGHALSAFFMATFLSLFYSRFKIPFFLMASLTGFSRLYTGVHYPGDVIVGAIIGIVLASIYYLIIVQIMKLREKSTGAKSF